MTTVDRVRKDAHLKYSISYYPLNNKLEWAEQDVKLELNKNDSINFGDVCDEPSNIPLVTSIHPHILFGNIHFNIIVDRAFEVKVEHNACDGFRHIIIAKEKVLS